MPQLSKKTSPLNAFVEAFKEVMFHCDAAGKDYALEIAKRWEYIATVTCKGEDIPKTVDFNAVGQSQDYQKWLKAQDERDLQIQLMREHHALQINRLAILEDENKSLKDKLDRAMERLIRLETK